VVAGREVAIYYLLDSVKTLLASARPERQLIPQLRALVAQMIALRLHIGERAADENRPRLPSHDTS
jgi:hypothetical protein